VSADPKSGGADGGGVSADRDAEQRDWLQDSELRGPPFADPEAARRRVILFGAVPLAAALSTLARAAGWRAFVVDPRARFATHERFPDAERVLVAWPEEAIAQLGGLDAETSVAVLSHDPVLDDLALGLALRSPARFIGAMGSRRTQAARRERLRACLTDGELERLSGPIGLDLGALSAPETALSILAEMVAVSHGRAGGRLKAADGRVRAQAP
jgi:xanthine dehydrogenase accessory factor